MKHIPNKIYLQIGEDCDAEDFKDLNEVTWCQVEIHSNDIEYVRSSQQPEDEVVAILKQIYAKNCGFSGCRKETGNVSHRECEIHSKLYVLIDTLAKHKERKTVSVKITGFKRGKPSEPEERHDKAN